MSCTSPKCFLVAKGRKAVPAIEQYGELPGSLVMYQGFPYRVAYVPCNQCIACRRERRMDYTVLQALEASVSEDAFFVTLTYDDEKVNGPVDSLVPSHLKTFNELMRKYAKYHGESYRYFGCGEYGDRKGRPHYHMTMFCSPRLLGIQDDSDAVSGRRDFLLSLGRFSRLCTALKDENGNDFWQSDVIASHWPYGAHRIYRANSDTFQYVAGYVVKKLYGADARAERLSGKINSYNFQSRPSIGYPWFKKYQAYLLNHDPVTDSIINTTVQAYGSKEWRVPRIMYRWLEKFDPDKYSFIKSVKSSLAEVPDVDDNRRKALYDAYRARSNEQNNQHKEIK